MPMVAPRPTDSSTILLPQTGQATGRGGSPNGRAFDSGITLPPVVFVGTECPSNADSKMGVSAFWHPPFEGVRAYYLIELIFAGGF
jgi:hypothetical protein